MKRVLMTALILCSLSAVGFAQTPAGKKTEPAKTQQADKKPATNKKHTDVASNQKQPSAGTTTSEKKSTAKKGQKSAAPKNPVNTSGTASTATVKKDETKGAPHNSGSTQAKHTGTSDTQHKEGKKHS